MESIRELAPILGRLNAKYGVFAVLGNCDRALGSGLICAQLGAQSIEVLINRVLHTGRARADSFWPAWIR